MKPNSLTVAIRVAVALASAAPTAFAQEQVVDLAELGTTYPGFRIEGEGLKGTRSVSGAGDVNGDGLADVVIGAPYADPAGEVYVVFGMTEARPVSLANLGTGGFRIVGGDTGDAAGFSVSGAGDVNGDGLDDVVIGAHVAEAGGNDRAGASYVVFGKASSGAVELANLGAAGFRIDGVDVQDLSGRSVSGAGDVNGDGLDDLVIGAPTADPGGKDRAGESYVVFGKTDSNPVELANLGSGGFRIDGNNAFEYSGYSVAGAGDVNGDGLDDLIVVAPRGYYGSGANYVVFGKTSNGTVDLANLGAGGFLIQPSGFSFGRTADGAGDVNGDGLDDLVVGTFMECSEGCRPSSFVIFGKADQDPVDLQDPDLKGFRIDPGTIPCCSRVANAGSVVSGAGDVNGDGLDDLILSEVVIVFGSKGSIDFGYYSSVIFGKGDSAPVDLTNLADGGFRITRPGAVSGGGDINGDGLGDMIVGVSANQSFVVLGNQDVVDTRLLPPPMNLAAGDRLGRAVATDGNLFVVGLPNADGASTDSGRVVVYRSEGAALIEEAIIEVPPGHFATNFGGALALEGNRLVVGAPGTDPGQAKGGNPTALQSALFERLSDGSWTMKGSLSSMNGNAGDQFGASVALDGDTIVVGAPGDAEGMDSGAAYVYQLANDTVMQMRKLKPTDGISDGKFGAAVAADNGRIAIGAPDARMGATATGTVQLFEQLGDNLMNLADRGAMTGSRSGAGDAFGASVALHGDKLLVGAPGEDEGGANSGAAYVFDPQNMAERSRLEPVSPQADAEFGRAVGVSADGLAIGAPGLNGGNGGAFRFDDNFRQTRLTRALNGQQAFGASVALSGEALVIGAPDTESEAGAAVLQRNPAVIYRGGFE